MKKLLLISFFSLLCIFVVTQILSYQPSSNGAPPYGEPKKQVPQGVLDWLKDWKRPEGPAKVALQVGHWKNDQVPEELHRLRGNTGAEGGGKIEWEVNYEIAQLTKELLEKQNILVEILPATVPEKYWADVFVAIHADSSTKPSLTGYKAAASWKDATGKASKLVEIIEEEYQKSTGLTKDDNITQNMRGYYAFSWWRYSHAVHPMTTSAILETGFLTNYSDQQLLIHQPELSAQGLALGIIKYLDSEKLLASTTNE